MKTKDLEILEKMGIDFTDLEENVKKLFESKVTLDGILLVINGPELDGEFVMKFGDIDI